MIQRQFNANFLSSSFGGPLAQLVEQLTLNPKPNVPKCHFTYKIEPLSQWQKPKFVRNGMVWYQKEQQLNGKITASPFFGRDS